MLWIQRKVSASKIQGLGIALIMAILGLVVIAPPSAARAESFICLSVEMEGFKLASPGYIERGDATEVLFEVTPIDQAIESFAVYSAQWRFISPVIPGRYRGSAGVYNVLGAPLAEITGVHSIQFVAKPTGTYNGVERFAVTVKGFSPQQPFSVRLVGSHTQSSVTLDMTQPACRRIEPPEREEGGLLPDEHAPTWAPVYQAHVLLDDDLTYAWSASERQALWEVGLPAPDRVTLSRDVFGEAGLQQVALSVPPAPPVGGWAPLLRTDFDTGFPSAGMLDGCRLINRSEGAHRWVFSPNVGFAGLPGSLSPDGLSAFSGWQDQVATGSTGSSAQLVCVFDGLWTARNLMMQFALRMDDLPAGDSFFVGLSTDGQTFTGRRWHGMPPSADGAEGWSQQRLFYPFVGERAGNNGRVAVMWEFQSADGRPRPAGVWLDDLLVERYDSVSQECRNSDSMIVVPDTPGEMPVSKGINLPAYPIATPTGLRGHVENLRASDVGWVRLEFQAAMPPSVAAESLRGAGGMLNYIDLKHYDTLIDLLCAGGPPMGVLGLIDYHTEVSTSWRESGSIEDAFAQSFANHTRFLVRYYRDRIRFWEVWNEPDFTDSYLRPGEYARLLDLAHQVIKEEDGAAQVLFGGLGGADWTAASYFRQVIDNLGSDPPPYDIFAIHPYPSKEYRLEGAVVRDPSYLRYDQPTVLEKFLEIMRAAGHAPRPIWVTEVGWNRAADSTSPDTLGCVRIYETMVNGVEQARYLPQQFDILFRETAWEPGVPSVAKIFWYQYMDVGLQLSEAECAGRKPSAENVQPLVVDWWFGLFSGTDPEVGISEPVPNRSACTYRAYPDSSAIDVCMGMDVAALADSAGASPE